MKTVQRTMPWRSKTLTEYKPGTFDDGTSSFDPDIEAENFSGLFGPHGGDENLDYEPTESGLEEWELAEFSHDFSDTSARRFSDAADLGATQVPRGPVLDDSNFSQLVTSAFIRNREPLRVQMPWDKGVGKIIFGSKLGKVSSAPLQSKQWVKVDSPCASSDLHAFGQLVEEPKKVLVGALFEKAFSAISDRSFQQQRTELLNTAVDKWFSIIRVNLLGSAAGREIIGYGTIQEQKEGAFQTIEAIIGIRSRSTAVARANSLIKFFRWRASETDDDGKPVTESDAWTYVCHLKQSGAAATRASSFLSACRYALHVFGFGDFAEVCGSRRLRGLAELLHSGKEPIKQARVLTTSQVLQLHSMLVDPNMNKVDKAFVAYIVVALYSRCRHSDLANIDTVFLDYDEQGGYVEITTKFHKCARTASQKSQFLPILAPALGIDGKEWVSSVVEGR